MHTHTDFQFSWEVAQEACMSLNDQATKIEANRYHLAETVSAMRGVWQGDLADTITNRLRQHDVVLERVGGFVNLLNDHIAACKKNYDLTVEKAKDRIAFIADMFL